MAARRVLSALVAVLLLTTAAGLWVLGRPGTLVYAADWLAWRTRGDLQFEGVSGSLLATIYVHQVRWRAGSSEAVFEDVELDWSPASLVAGTLAFAQAKARSARVFVADVRAAQGTPRLPLRVRFDQVAVGELTVRRHQPVEFVEAAYRPGAEPAGAEAPADEPAQAGPRARVAIDLPDAALIAGEALLVSEEATLTLGLPGAPSSWLAAERRVTYRERVWGFRDFAGVLVGSDRSGRCMVDRTTGRPLPHDMASSRRA